jgi:small subunit ribosomal protein S1
VPGRLRDRQIVRGHVARMTDFGVFVELLPGVDGLLHLTEIPRSRHGDMKRAAEERAELQVLITSVDAERRRIGLALAPEGLQDGDTVKSSVAVGAVVTGAVERVEPFGVFLRVGPGQVGLIPNGEMGTAKNADHRKEFPPGTEVRVAVLSIEDGGKRIRLSRAQVQRLEEESETRGYLDSARRTGGFGMTLGEALRNSRQGQKR